MPCPKVLEDSWKSQLRDLKETLEENERQKEAQIQEDQETEKGSRFLYLGIEMLEGMRRDERLTVDSDYRNLIIGDIDAELLIYENLPEEFPQFKDVYLEEQEKEEKLKKVSEELAQLLVNEKETKESSKFIFGFAPIVWIIIFFIMLVIGSVLTTSIDNSLPFWGVFLLALIFILTASSNKMELQSRDDFLQLLAMVLRNKKESYDQALC